MSKALIHRSYSKRSPNSFLSQTARREIVQFPLPMPCPEAALPPERFILELMPPTWLPASQCSPKGEKTCPDSRSTRMQNCTPLTFFSPLRNMSYIQTKMTNKQTHSKPRMWANAQHDGRRAEYRWRPLLVCRAVTLPRPKPLWNLQGCSKLANSSQPLVGRSSPYYEDMWRRYRCLTSFFPIVDTCLSCEDTARQSCAMVPKWRFLCPVFQPVACSTCQTCILNSH